MLNRRGLRPVVLCGLLIVASTSAVRADAIDGEWCNDKGKRFTVKGPDITTPGGTATTGDYSRHAFSYTTPSTEPLAGTSVFLRLLNEQTVNMRVGSSDPSTPVEVWTRCNPVS